MMTHPNRPKIKLTLTTVDKLLEIIGWIVVFVMWAIVVVNYSKLPDIIPIHFNAEGVVDGYGSKSMIWILLLVGSILYAGMTYLNKFPHVFSFTTTITPENALQQYTITTKMLRYVKLLIVLIICYLLFKTIYIPLGGVFVN